MRTTMASLLVLLWELTGCGAGAGPAPAAQAAVASDSTGEETPLASDADQPAPATTDGESSPVHGSGIMTVRALVDRRPVAAKVRVLDAAGQAQTEGDAGAPIELAAGAHRVEVTITDRTSLADRPTQGREVFVEPGKNTEVEANFPWAKVQLNVLVGGRSQAALVKLFRNEQVVAEMKAGAKPAAISPGKYEADVLLQGTTIRVKGLLFPEGATQTVPVRVQF